MQLRHEAEEQVGRRYDHETVRKAAVLASRLQQEHRETLSREEAEALATELGIAPRYMASALQIVSQNKIRQEQGSVTQDPRRRLRGLALIASLTAGLLFIGGLRASRMATPAIASPVPVAPHSALSNGSFEEPSSTIGRHPLPRDWELIHGDARLVNATPLNQVLQLGNHAHIEQVFPAAPGWRYRATIKYRGVPTAERAGHFAQVDLAGTWANLSAVSGDPSAEAWTEQQIEFTAAETIGRIKFETRPDLGPGGIQIDDVSITPIGP